MPSHKLNSTDIAEGELWVESLDHDHSDWEPPPGAPHRQTEGTGRQSASGEGKPRNRCRLLYYRRTFDRRSMPADFVEGCSSTARRCQ